MKTIFINFLTQFDSWDYFKGKHIRQKVSFYLHINVSLIAAHINYLKVILNLPNTKFNIIDISGSRLSCKNPLAANTSYPVYIVYSAQKMKLSIKDFFS